MRASALSSISRHWKPGIFRSGNEQFLAGDDLVGVLKFVLVGFENLHVVAGLAADVPFCFFSSCVQAQLKNSWCFFKMLLLSYGQKRKTMT